MSLVLGDPLTPEQAQKELQKMLEKAFMPTKMGVSPAHGVVFFEGKESELSIHPVVVAVRIADLLALAASLTQQVVLPIMEQIPTEPLPRVKTQHKLFRNVEGAKS